MLVWYNWNARANERLNCWIVVVNWVLIAEADMTRCKLRNGMRDFVFMTRKALMHGIGETYPEQSGGEVGTT